MTHLPANLAHPAADKERDDEKRITHWDDPYSMVSMTFQECPTCKTMGGFKHSKGCKHARHRLMVVRASRYGNVNYMEWCREEAAHLASKGQEVAIKCYPADREPESSDWICLVRV